MPKQRKYSVIITHPDFNDPGGVAQYYGKIRSKFHHPVQHYIVGKRPEEKRYAVKIKRIIKDYFGFFLKLKNDQCDIVQVNPSLDLKSFVRESILVLFARMMRRKIIVFIRGWNKEFENDLERKYLWIFKLIYGKVDLFIVLSSEFKRKLEQWGFKQPIYIEVTIADDEIFKRFNIHSTLSNRLKAEKKRILFISRIIKSKGIYETVEAVSILKKRYPEIQLVVAGDGDELENVKSFVRDLLLTDVLFAGYVKGEDKRSLFESCHILSFPSYHGEGMPNTIVESMGFGLPIVTRPVGGTADFFRNGVHGFATTSKDPKAIAGLIEKLLFNPDLYKKISLNNYTYAHSKFLASQAAIRLEKIYDSLP